MAAWASLHPDLRPSFRQRTYECARCGKRQTADRMVFSTHTRDHYCAQIDACTRRAKKGKR